jgi:hypothetical protein
MLADVSDTSELDASVLVAEVVGLLNEAECYIVAPEDEQLEYLHRRAQALAAGGSSEQERPVAPRAAADAGYASSAGGVSPFAANPARTISSSARGTPATSTPVSAARSSGGYGHRRVGAGSSSRISRSSHAVSCW